MVSVSTQEERELKIVSLSLNKCHLYSSRYYFTAGPEVVEQAKRVLELVSSKSSTYDFKMAPVSTRRSESAEGTERYHHQKGMGTSGWDYPLLTESFLGSSIALSESRNAS